MSLAGDSTSSSSQNEQEEHAVVNGESSPHSGMYTIILYICICILYQRGGTSTAVSSALVPHCAAVDHTCYCVSAHSAQCIVLPNHVW
jgi:hypothetical protein